MAKRVIDLEKVVKPFQELTYLGRVRRMRRLAHAALAAFGIADARFKLLRQAGNTLFRVYMPDLPTSETSEDLFQEGQYLLRVHEPGYQQPDAIQLELAWLAAMRRDAGLPVPEPVPTLDGRLLLPVSLPGIPDILARESYLLSREVLLMEHMLATQESINGMTGGPTGYVFPN